MADSEALKSLEAQVQGQRNFDSPPLHLWHPELSGKIPIKIAADGVWYHQGGEIKRVELVRLFASILRREEDEHYYLVTPVEKWQIEVDLHPLVIVDFDLSESERGQILSVELNTGKRVIVGSDHPLFLDSSVNDVAAVSLWHGLSAIFSRAAWVRLADVAESAGDEMWLESSGIRFSLLGSHG